ncbi:unnamed protein product [Caenorhabditis sp. 36 PRJEB53466]|nr:unnamed protein product [Caenorhabditis sp. 36 PRJEB53466]
MMNKDDILAQTVENDANYKVRAALIRSNDEIDAKFGFDTHSEAIVRYRAGEGREKAVSNERNAAEKALLEKVSDNVGLRGGHRLPRLRNFDGQVWRRRVQ